MEALALAPERSVVLLLASVSSPHLPLGVRRSVSQSLPDLHRHPAEARRLKRAVNSQSVDAPEATLDSYLYCTTLPIEFLRPKIVCVCKNNQGPKKVSEARYPMP